MRSGPSLRTLPPEPVKLAPADEEKVSNIMEVCQVQREEAIRVLDACHMDETMALERILSGNGLSSWSEVSKKKKPHTSQSRTPGHRDRDRDRDRDRRGADRRDRERPHHHHHPSSDAPHSHPNGRRGGRNYRGGSGRKRGGAHGTNNHPHANNNQNPSAQTSTNPSSTSTSHPKSAGGAAEKQTQQQYVHQQTQQQPPNSSTIPQKNPTASDPDQLNSKGIDAIQSWGQAKDGEYDKTNGTTPNGTADPWADKPGAPPDAAKTWTGNEQAGAGAWALKDGAADMKDVGDSAGKGEVGESAVKKSAAVVPPPTTKRFNYAAAVAAGTSHEKPVATPSPVVVPDRAAAIPTERVAPPPPPPPPTTAATPSTTTPVPDSIVSSFVTERLSTSTALPETRPPASLASISPSAAAAAAAAAAAISERISPVAAQLASIDADAAVNENVDDLVGGETSEARQHRSMVSRTANRVAAEIESGPTVLPVAVPATSESLEVSVNGETTPTPTAAVSSTTTSATAIPSAATPTPSVRPDTSIKSQSPVTGSTWSSHPATTTATVLDAPVEDTPAQLEEASTAVVVASAAVLGSDTSGDALSLQFGSFGLGGLDVNWSTGSEAKPAETVASPIAAATSDVTTTPATAAPTAVPSTAAPLSGTPNSKATVVPSPIVPSPTRTTNTTPSAASAPSSSPTAAVPPTVASSTTAPVVSSAPTSVSVPLTNIGSNPMVSNTPLESSTTTPAAAAATSTASNAPTPTSSNTTTTASANNASTANTGASAAPVGVAMGTGATGSTVASGPASGSSGAATTTNAPTAGLGDMRINNNNNNTNPSTSIPNNANPQNNNVNIGNPNNSSSGLHLPNVSSAGAGAGGTNSGMFPPMLAMGPGGSFPAPNYGPPYLVSPLHTYSPAPALNSYENGSDLGTSRGPNLAAGGSLPLYDPSNLSAMAASGNGKYSGIPGLDMSGLPGMQNGGGKDGLPVNGGDIDKGNGLGTSGLGSGMDALPYMMPGYPSMQYPTMYTFPTGPYPPPPGMAPAGPGAFPYAAAGQVSSQGGRGGFGFEEAGVPLGGGGSSRNGSAGLAGDSMYTPGYLNNSMGHNNNSKSGGSDASGTYKSVRGNSGSGGAGTGAGTGNGGNGAGAGSGSGASGSAASGGAGIGSMGMAGAGMVGGMGSGSGGPYNDYNGGASAAAAAAAAVGTGPSANNMSGGAHHGHGSHGHMANHNHGHNHGHGWGNRQMANGVRVDGNVSSGMMSNGAAMGSAAAGGGAGAPGGPANVNVNHQGGSSGYVDGPGAAGGSSAYWTPQQGSYYP